MKKIVSSEYPCVLSVANDYTPEDTFRRNARVLGVFNNVKDLTNAISNICKYWADNEGHYVCEVSISAYADHGEEIDGGESVFVQIQKDNSGKLLPMKISLENSINKVIKSNEGADSLVVQLFLGVSATYHTESPHFKYSTKGPSKSWTDYAGPRYEKDFKWKPTLIINAVSTKMNKLVEEEI